MFRRIRILFALVLSGGVACSCSGDRVMTSRISDADPPGPSARQTRGQIGRPLSKPVVNSDLTDTVDAENKDLARALVMARVRQDQTPLGDVTVKFSRSVSGRAANYEWSGTTDERGEARVEIGADDASGYYQARAWRNGSLLGSWSSIPINVGSELTVDLPVGGRARVTVSVSADNVAPDETKHWGTTVIGDAGTDTTGTWGEDAYELSAAAITGDTLAVTVSYGGGCKDHQFTLVASGAFMESDPVQLNVAFAHNANGDPCERWVTEDYFFSLAPIKAQYQKLYQQDSGIIILRLKNAPGGALVYEFAK